MWHSCTRGKTDRATSAKACNLPVFQAIHRMPWGPGGHARWHELRFARIAEDRPVLPSVSGTECIRILVKSGFDPTEERDGAVWLEREACGVSVPRDPELDRRILEAILASARIEPRAFNVLLAEVRGKA